MSCSTQHACQVPSGQSVHPSVVNGYGGSCPICSLHRCPASSAHRLSSASSCPPMGLRVGTQPPATHADRTGSSHRDLSASLCQALKPRWVAFFMVSFGG